MTAPAVELSGITKRYPGVIANDRVSFRARFGEIHAVVGENGAGKTTLMRVLAGVTRPDEGTIRIDGKRVTFRSAADAARAGVGMVHQHFTLVPVFTVLENLLLGAEPGFLPGRAAPPEVRKAAERLGFLPDLDARVSGLTVGERQRVEILRTLSRGARILVLDEPTAVLTPAETRDFFRTLRNLAREGHAVVFISHRLEEVRAASDRVTVMRRGRTVATLETARATEADLARLMVGREVLVREGGRERRPPAGEPALEVRGLDLDSDRGLPAVRDVSFSIRPGEVLGLAGVMGNGQRELVEALAGLRRPRGGRILLGGEDVTGLGVRQRLRAGVVFVPEDRRDQGLVLTLSAAENLALGAPADPAFRGGLLLRREPLRAAAARWMRALDVRPPDPDRPVGDLSGGNQQKVLLARALASSPRVLLLAEPCRGLDVGAIERVHGEIRAAANRGAAILLVSSDLPEILSLSDRILVLRRGRISGEVKAGRTTEEELGLMMAGGGA